jgi:hypothetical protein
METKICSLVGHQIIVPNLISPMKNRSCQERSTRVGSRNYGINVLDSSVSNPDIYTKCKITDLCYNQNQVMKPSKATIKIFPQLGEYIIAEPP